MKSAQTYTFKTVILICLTTNVITFTFELVKITEYLNAIVLLMLPNKILLCCNIVFCKPEKEAGKSECK